MIICPKNNRPRPLPPPNHHNKIVEPIDKNKMRDEIVDIIASGYEWICPSCDNLNRIIGYVLVVTCVHCGNSYQTDLPEHAYG